MFRNVFYTTKSFFKFRQCKLGFTILLIKLCRSDTKKFFSNNFKFLRALKKFVYTKVFNKLLEPKKNLQI